MARKCGVNKPCGMSQGIYNPFFQNGAYWYGQGGSEPSPYDLTIQEIKDLLGSKLVALYDVKDGNITVNSSNDITQISDLSDNGYHLVVETNGPKWNELDTVYFVSGSQERVRNNSIIPAVQSNNVGIFGNWQAVTSDTFMNIFSQAGGTAFMGVRNQGATFIWGGTGSTGTTNRNAGNNNQPVVYGLQVNNDVDINTLVGTTVQTHVDTTTSVPKDIATLSALFLGSTGLASPTYYTFFMRTLIITNGLVSTTDLSTLGQLIADLTAPKETIFVAELGQSNIEGRDGDTTNGKYPFQIGKGREWNGTADIEIKTTRGNATGGSHANYFCSKFYELTGKVSIMCESATGGTGLTPTASTPNWSGSSTLRSGAETKINSGLANYGKAAPNFALWAQGETDAELMDSNGAYTKAIVKLAMQDVIDWWQTTYPGVPFIISELGIRNTGETTGWTNMRAIQNEIVAENAGVYIGFSNAKNFLAEGKMIDVFHYNYVGYREMGEALATFAASVL